MTAYRVLDVRGLATGHIPLLHCRLECDRRLPRRFSSDTGVPEGEDIPRLPNDVMG